MSLRAGELPGKTPVVAKVACQRRIMPATGCVGTLRKRFDSSYPSNFKQQHKITKVMELRKATRKKAKIRLGLSSVSGGGKTYSALLIAKGLAGTWDKVAIIDTENGSADLYSQLGDYNVITLCDPFTPESYIEAIKKCENAGMEVVIVDSISHEWEWCTNENTKLGGRFQDWAKITPRHDAFKAAMLSSKCHIITTVRRKQDYDMTKDSNGKVKVEKAGLKEQTRDGWEYELTVNLELDIDHNITASKDRTGLFMGKPYFIATEETGQLIKQWCENGVDELDLAVNAMKSCTTLEALKSCWTKFNFFQTEKRFQDAKEEMKSQLTKKSNKPERTAFTKDKVNDELLSHLHEIESAKKSAGETFSLFGYIESLFIITPDDVKFICDELGKYEKKHNLPRP